MNRGKQNIFVFDVCDTLFYSNTTFDFISYVLKIRSNFKYSVFKALTKRESPLAWPLMVLTKVSSTDWPKKFALWLLKGLSKDNLYKLGQNFLHDYLANCKIEQTHSMLLDYNQNNTMVLLLSASIDPVIAAIAGSVNAEYRCTELEYDAHGIFTGNIKKEMTGKKLLELQDILKNTEYNLTVATDNYSDRTLVEAAHKRYVVVYNNKEKAFWQDLSPEFIQLYSL